MADVLDIAKRRGFFWSSFEIYHGCSGFYTYGPLGALMKLRIENLIREYYMIQEGCILIEAPILTTEDPWVASGHVKSFTDMTIECQKCGEAYRADQLIEEKIGKDVEGMGLGEIQKIIRDKKITCPKCSGVLGNIYDYNLMFKTYIGPGKNKISGYLRPETAQTTYMPFKRLYELGRRKLPLGVIQFGKSFRNEISPRKGLVRLREFSQAEVQFFIDPKQGDKHPRFSEVKNLKVPVLTKQGQKKNQKPRMMKIGELVKKKFASEFIAYFLAKSLGLYLQMGIDPKKLRMRQHRDDERCFYSKDTWDVEFLSDNYGRIELVGIADRTDYDLKRHMDLSRQDMKVDWNGEKFIPHVIEIAYGIDRPLFCVMESCLREDRDRVYFAFPPKVSPYQVAVFPLVRKNGLPKLARGVFEALRKGGFLVLYDETGSIGRLYYRQDEAGTPYCITIDYDSKKRNDVTVRNRDNQKQIRVNIKKLPEVLRGLFEGEKFETLGRVIKQTAGKQRARK
jgi:glycyl-tRNA synthetase